MLIAVDTNVLLDQAIGDADVIDALSVLRERLPHARFIITPTALQELAWQADRADEEEDREAAAAALDQLLDWGYEPLNVIPVGHGIVEQISLKLRMSGIIPAEEENDASIIAEAALIGCNILLSADAHMIAAEANPDFRPLLKECHVEGDTLGIARPRIIVQRFYRRH